MTMRRITFSLAAVVALLAVSAAGAAQPSASCVALITSYEASQLPPASVGAEVSGLAATPGLGATLVSPLARAHLGSIEACQQAE
jgi:hypothetical protein